MSKRQPTTRFCSALVLRLGLLGGSALGLAACASGVDTHGNLPDPEVVQQIQPGVHRQTDVLSLLGSPSAVSTFEESRWYYIGSKSETVAFFDPDVLERSILVVSFTDEGVVGEKQVYTLEDGKDVSPVGRVTPTEGKKLTVLQQLFGNIGRFTGAGNEQPRR